MAERPEVAHNAAVYEHQSRVNSIGGAAEIEPKPGVTEHQELALGLTATYVGGDASQLSPEHQHYLLDRHGTLDLDPLPGHGDADPYNWATWKVGFLPQRLSFADEREARPLYID